MIGLSFVELKQWQSELLKIFLSTKINFKYHKSRVKFSTSVQLSDMKKLAQILKITPSNSIGTYLNCSNIDKKRTRLDFSKINDKMAQQLSGLKALMLSNVYRVVLIKSNLTGIPQYSMNQFKLPSISIKRLFILT